MSEKEIQRLQTELGQLGVICHQVDFARGIGTPQQVRVALRQLAIIVQAQHFDLIHCHSPIGGVCGRLIGRKYKIKVIYTAHGFHFFKGGSRLSWLTIYPVEKYLSRYSDRLITINQEDTTLAKTKFRAKKVSYVPGIGIDVAAIEKTTVDQADKRQNLGIPASATVILSVGELNDNKNHATVIKAIAKLDRPDVYYLICGIGDNKAALQQLAREQGLADRVQLLGYRTDISALMKMADFFVFPSFREGLPAALMEAMAAGLPVIASATRGNTDLIEDGVNGYLFSASDVNALHNRLHRLLDDEDKQRDFVAASSEKIGHFSRRVVQQRMRSIYSAVATD